MHIGYTAFHPITTVKCNRSTYLLHASRTGFSMSAGKGGFLQAGALSCRLTSMHELSLQHPLGYPAIGRQDQDLTTPVTWLWPYGHLDRMRMPSIYQSANKYQQNIQRPGLPTWPAPKTGSMLEKSYGAIRLRFARGLSWFSVLPVGLGLRVLAKPVFLLGQELEPCERHWGSTCLWKLCSPNVTMQVSSG